jgi:hypothetical protein
MQANFEWIDYILFWTDGENANKSCTSTQAGMERWGFTGEGPRAQQTREGEVVVPHAGEGWSMWRIALAHGCSQSSISNLQYLIVGGHDLVTCEKLQ